jgi:4-amino-4-deoxy-L-arabinose transferase-like glycosyltransferase
MARKNKPELNKKMSPTFINIIVVIVLIILSLAVIANTVSKPVARDEQMYMTGAVLLAQGKMIYRDFSYAAQMPYHPLLCAALFKVFGTTYYLLVGRAVSCVCDILVMLSIVGIFRHVFRSFTTSGMILGLCAAVLYIFNPLVDYANGYAWNHDIVIFCVVLSFWLFISTDFEQKSKYWRVAVIGALLTFATFMRITTALVELLFFVLLLSIHAGSIKERLKNALPFLLAAAVVSIWPVWVIAQAPRAFFLDLVTIPMLYGRWLHEIGMVYNKFALTFACLTTPGYFVLLLLVIYLCFSMLFLRRKLKIPNRINLLLAALLPAVFFIIALIPPTMWRQYLAVPVPFLAIGLAFPLLYLRKLTSKAGIGGHFKIATGVTVVCTFVALISYPLVLYRTPIAIVPESWVPVEIHKVSEDIVAKANAPKLMLTLGPLLALEGGGEIYTELSAGDIIYRIADSLSSDEQRITHTVGVQTIANVVRQSPPSAIIIGTEPAYFYNLEEPLKSFAETTWHKEVYKNNFYENNLTVYFRP